MGNSRNKSRKKARHTPSKKQKIFQDGGDLYKDPVPSAKKIGKNTANFDCFLAPEYANLKEGTIFLDMSILFTVFDDILKCGGDLNSYIDMKKKNGFSYYNFLQCKSLECEWKCCFNASKKQGRSNEMNVIAVLAFRDIGRRQSAMSSFTKLMNMPAPPARRIVIKIQNTVLPVLKQ